MTLEELVQTFADHSIQAKIENEKLIKQFTEVNPGQTIPKWLLEDFSLPQALRLICEEIINLKRWL